jgi:hypothetical protein
MQVLSYGAGVQTFGILCLIKLGQLKKPNLVIFADTQNEKDATYQHIEEVAKPLCKELGLEFVTVSRGNLLMDSYAKGNTPRPPICSKTYKTRVIESYLRKTYPDVKKFYTWIGISLDEEHRSFSQSEVSYVEKRYPLLELELSRDEVIEVINQAGYKLPVKSGCWCCPWNSSRNYWRGLKANAPEKFQLVNRIEKETGHKLSNGNFWLVEIDAQLEFDFNALATDEGCTQSECMV